MSMSDCIECPNCHKPSYKRILSICRDCQNCGYYQYYNFKDSG